MVAATVQLARWLDASSRRPRGCVRLNRQKPQSPSLRSRLNDDRTFRSEKSTYLSRARSQKLEARSEKREARIGDPASLLTAMRFCPSVSALSFKNQTLLRFGGISSEEFTFAIYFSRCAFGCGQVGATFFRGFPLAEDAF
ncbi:MAG: hypothetical protein QOH31_4139 [Verrucomicrobiota bacterium]